jgi:hypothetical protein
MLYTVSMQGLLAFDFTSRLFARRIGVQHVEDPHQPRGYRELRSRAEMRKLLNRKIVEQDRKCAICHEEFTDYNDMVPDHRNPIGMGEAWRDDHPDNIQATHWWCNGMTSGATVRWLPRPHKIRLLSIGSMPSCAAFLIQERCLQVERRHTLDSWPMTSVSAFSNSRLTSGDSLFA